MIPSLQILSRLLFVTFFPFTTLVSQSVSAVVIQVNGEAFRAGQSDFRLRTGSTVVDHDSIVLSGHSSITLLEPDGMIKKFDRSLRWKAPIEREPLVESLVRQNFGLNEWLTRAGRMERQHRRAAIDQSVVMVYPRNSALQNPPTHLVWRRNGNENIKVDVSIRCYENDFSYDDAVASDSLSLAHVPLQEPGKQYFWYVRESSSELSDIPTAVWFRILSSSQRQKFEKEKETLASILKQDTSSVAYELLYANLLISYELYEECRQTLERLAITEKQNPMINTFFAVIYDRMELPDESQKYIDYSEQRVK